MKRKAKVPALKRKARELARPLYARPKALEKIKQTTALRAEHIQIQHAAQRRIEHDRLTGLIHSNLAPQIKTELMSQRSKL